MNTSTTATRLSHRLRWLLANRETFEFRVGVSAESLIHRIRQRVAGPTEILTPLRSKPFRGRVEGDSFHPTIRFPHTFDYRSCIDGSVTPTGDDACVVRFEIRGASLAVAMPVVFLAIFVGVLIFLVSRGESVEKLFWTFAFAAVCGYAVYAGRKSLQKVSETTREIFEDICTAKDTSDRSSA